MIEVQEWVTAGKDGLLQHVLLRACWRKRERERQTAFVLHTAYRSRSSPAKRSILAPTSVSATQKRSQRRPSPACGCRWGRRGPAGGGGGSSCRIAKSGFSAQTLFHHPFQTNVPHIIPTTRYFCCFRTLIASFQPTAAAANHTHFPASQGKSRVVPTTHEGGRG